MKGNAKGIPTKKNGSFYRYLRPGALAQLRNSQILSRSHKPNSHFDFTNRRDDSPAPPPPQISMMDEVPCFLGNMVCGPSCLKRKKLLAARSVYFLNLAPPSSVLETATNNNGPLISVLHNPDALVVH